MSVYLSFNLIPRDMQFWSGKHSASEICPIADMCLLSGSIFLSRFIFIFNYVEVCEYVYVSAGALRGQRHWIHLKLELQVIESWLTWGLWTELRSSGKTACCSLSLSHLCLLALNYPVRISMIQGRFYTTSNSNPFWILVAWGQKIDTKYPASCSRAAEDST